MDGITSAVTLNAGSNVTITDNSPSAGHITITAASGLSSPLTTKGDVWGYSTGNTRIPVGADGTVLTADATQTTGVKWATTSSGSGLVKLFESTLASTAASIDTGAGGIASGHGDLICYLYARSNRAAAVDSTKITVNADTGSNYDEQFLEGTGTTVDTAPEFAESSLLNTGLATMAGNNATAGVFSFLEIVIPAYDKTTGFKVAKAISCVPLESGSPDVQLHAAQWRSTTAVSRLSVAPGIGTLFEAGTRFVIYGTQ